MKKDATHSHRSGFVAIVGRPNVGKSTLINALLSQKIAAVSPRPQTTRINQMGILTRDDAQIIFVDTPGVHHPRHKLGNKMNEKAGQSLEDCDVILFLVDASQAPTDEDVLLANLTNRLKHPHPVILVLNKTDLANSEILDKNKEAFANLVPIARQVETCATRGEGIAELIAQAIAHLPENPSLFPESQTTDLFERDLCADLIREASLILLRDEVPHGIAVRIDQFTERGDQGAYIEATIFVEKESHKGIVIGRGGQMLKEIGSHARREIETMTGRKVFLRLRVKVRKNWRDDEGMLRWLGYS